MTTMRPTLARLLGLSMAVTLMIGGGDGSPSAKQQCWEECLHEIAGRCFLWKKRCEMIEYLPGKPLSGMGEDFFDRSPAFPQTIPNGGAPKSGGGY